jgi:hypothetical protein
MNIQPNEYGTKVLMIHGAKPKTITNKAELENFVREGLEEHEEHSDFALDNFVNELAEKWQKASQEYSELKQKYKAKSDEELMTILEKNQEEAEARLTDYDKRLSQAETTSNEERNELKKVEKQIETEIAFAKNNSNLKAFLNHTIDVYSSSIGSPRVYGISFKTSNYSIVIYTLSESLTSKTFDAQGKIINAIPGSQYLLNHAKDILINRIEPMVQKQADKLNPLKLINDISGGFKWFFVKLIEFFTKLIELIPFNQKKDDSSKPKDSKIDVSNLEVSQVTSTTNEPLENTNAKVPQVKQLRNI